MTVTPCASLTTFVAPMLTPQLLATPLFTVPAFTVPAFLTFEIIVALHDNRC
ncbi:MAG: hypothetical protein H7232_08855 [Aeromicrobium sp.]|nr:hypothetical protein [Burkholderiales bacterium]